MTVDEDLVNRISNAVCEDKDAISCPNCGMLNSKEIEEEINWEQYIPGRKLFSTMICLSCKHEWVV